jgi:hypothetical protein
MVLELVTIHGGPAYVVAGDLYEVVSIQANQTTLTKEQ